MEVDDGQGVGVEVGGEVEKVLYLRVGIREMEQEWSSSVRRRRPGLEKATVEATSVVLDALGRIRRSDPIDCLV